MPLGRVKASQFIINEARGVIDEHDVVDVGVRGGGDAGVVGDACSGAVPDSCCSDSHCGDVGAVCGSANSVGSVGSGGLSGAMSAPLSGAMGAPSSSPIGQYSKEEGENAGSACVLNPGGRVCSVGGNASLGKEVERVSASTLCAVWDSLGLSSLLEHPFVLPLRHVSPSGITNYVPPPQAASSSRAGGARRVDYPVIGKYGVTCGYSDGSSYCGCDVISSGPNGE